jgi:hypothetical protein
VTCGVEIEKGRYLVTGGLDAQLMVTRLTGSLRFLRKVIIPGLVLLAALLIYLIMNKA